MSPETRETRVSGPRRRAGGVEGVHGETVVEITDPVVHHTLRATEVRRPNRTQTRLTRYCR